MGKFNRIILIGRMCKDPELKNGRISEYAEFCISNVFVDKDKKEVVQEHVCKVSGKNAYVVVKNLRKGDLCCIEGTIDNHNSTQTIIAEKVTFLSKPKDKNSVC